MKYFYKFLLIVNPLFKQFKLKKKSKISKVRHFVYCYRVSIILVRTIATSLYFTDFVTFSVSDGPKLGEITITVARKFDHGLFIYE